MARFYGTVKGQRGSASRLGSKSSGLRVTAQTYHGSVTVSLYAQGDDDYVEIRAAEGSGMGGRLLYDGPVVGLAKSGVAAITHNEDSRIAQP